MTTSSKKELRIASWNVEGLQNYLGTEPRRVSLGEVVRALQMPDILCLQELRLRPQDSNLVSLAQSALVGYELTLTLASDPMNARFRGGRTYGVGTFVRKRLGATLLPSLAWDREGRIATVMLERERIAIVNVYAVNGTSKPHWDHELARHEGDRHGWKRRFHGHVAELVRALRQERFEVVAIGDWNVSQTRIDITPRLRTEEPHAGSRADFARTMIDDLGLVDVFRARNPTARAYTWFSPFSRPGKLDAARVDFALVSPGLVPRVVQASVDESVEHRFGSDHAPLSLSVSRSRLQAGHLS
ncbi:MAG TPA: exodeoxyribonuclease III [Polyangiaceae bacterium]|nr:exodeoxyribonuclease III [Polyangiaceae bacterium]